MRRKAQMEILGLAIVVILLTLVGLIVLRFFVNKEPSETRKNFVESEFAKTFLNTMLKTSSGCKKTTFQELLQVCATLESISCNSENSCVYARGRIAMLLEKSLVIQGKEYELTAKKASSDAEVFSAIKSDGYNEFCQNNHESSNPVPVPLYSDSLILMLNVCSPK